MPEGRVPSPELLPLLSPPGGRYPRLVVPRRTASSSSLPPRLHICWQLIHHARITVLIVFLWYARCCKNLPADHGCHPSIVPISLTRANRRSRASCPLHCLTRIHLGSGMGNSFTPMEIRSSSSRTLRLRRQRQNTVFRCSYYGAYSRG